LRKGFGLSRREGERWTVHGHFFPIDLDSVGMNFQFDQSSELSVRQTR
jgi:hypothetical protein